MKTCSYCGQENPDAQVCCTECGCEILIPDNDFPLEFPKTVPPPIAPLLDPNSLQNAFHFEDGFTRPDWEMISRLIQEKINREDLQQAWKEVGLLWLVQLREDLGGNYHVNQTKYFFLLCALDTGDTKRVLAFAERALNTIREQLADVAWTGFYGKHVVLLFTDEDDYYQYQAPFLREGMNPASGGVLLNSGYVHIALPYQMGITVRPALAHELTHNCVAHLPLPLWLNEGVATRVERCMTRPNDPVLHQELADQLRNYWTETNIQQFWAGTSFSTPGDAQHLSYSLAEIIVHMLAGDQQRFMNFLRQAHYMDGGQTAALNCLGTSLGDVAASFFGPGNWRPFRKALVDCWQDASGQTSGNGMRD